MILCARLNVDGNFFNRVLNMPYTRDGIGIFDVIMICDHPAITRINMGDEKHDYNQNVVNESVHNLCIDKIITYLSIADNDC